MTLPGPPSRRELLSAGLALAGSGLAAAALRPAVAGAMPTRDRDVLDAVLRIETLMAYCYERVLAEGSLRPQARAIVTGQLGHEREHVAAVGRELAARGGSSQVSWTPASATRELERLHIGARLANLGTQHQCVRLLVDLESAAEGAWFKALGRLTEPGLATLGASIMACEAQHWTQLSTISHHGDVKKTVPYPFVRGSSGY